jgi:hypothetical protein
MAESNIESFATRTRRMYAVASSARRSSSQDTQLLEEVEEQGDVVPLRPRVSRRQCQRKSVAVWMHVETPAELK